MLSKRIVPCLDVKDGRTVKGVNFVSLRDAGDPVELGALYAEQGADELVFLDITATHEKRKTLVELVLSVAREVNIPFTVGGGIGSVEDVAAALDAGADKVSVNSAAVKRPELIEEISGHFGAQCLVMAADAHYDGQSWTIYTGGGRHKTDKELFAWCYEAQERGAGEILFTSMNHDGTKQGFANEALATMSERLSIPVIASGGAGEKAHFAEAFIEGKADAALAASVFHYQEIPIPELKAYLRGEGVAVRF